MQVFAAFERLVDPYPDAPVATPPAGFWPFMRASTHGLGRWIVAMTLFTAAIGVFEALLYAWLGDLVDWLAKVPPARLWADERTRLLTLAGVLVGSIGLVALQSMFKQQALAGNFPMRLRWNFHRLMLGQSMGFYGDEFAGRVAAKVMQTALAVRDVWMILCDILVFIIIYFVTLVLVVGSFNAWMLVPLLGWLVLYGLTLHHYVPRLARVSQDQADARSLMTGRITDAYTNIATVKLFAHDRREAAHAQGAMAEFLATVHAQMRLATSFEILIHGLSMALVLGIAGTALALWVQGQVGIGAVAAATAMALRLNGISHWIMWEMATLFEHVGTVADGIQMLSRPRAVVDAPGAQALVVRQGEIRLEGVRFAYGGTKAVIDGLDLVIAPGEKIGLVGRSGAGKSTVVNLLLRFHDVAAGRILIDGQDIARVTQDSLRAQVGMVTQDTSLLHRSVRDNILYGRPDAGDGRHARRRRAGRGRRLHRRPGRRQGPHRLRRPCGRTRRQALGRAAPAHRHCAGDAEGRAHPAAGRSHQRAGQRGRGRHPGQPVPADGGQDGGGHRAPPVHHRRHGPAGGDGCRPHRRAGAA